MDIGHFLDLTVGGLTVGMIYALIALGYTMVYGVLEFINFAHGEVFTIGGFIGAGVVLLIGVDDTTSTAALIGIFALALISSVVLTAGLGWLIERIAYRPLRGASRIIPLLSAIGVSIVLQNLIRLIYGPDPIAMPIQMVPRGFVLVGDTRIQVKALIIMGVSVLLMVLLTLSVKRNRLGKAMRATSQDTEAAEMMGIDTDKTIGVTFILGSALAAIGGILVIINYGTMRFDTGFLFGLKAFTAAVLGGIGNIPGAVLGSVVLGLAENYGVGLDLGVLAWGFLAGAAVGIYIQGVHAPRRRIQHVTADQQTLAYERAIRRLYRIPLIPALRVLRGKRTDALLSVSARHALKLTGGNAFLLAMGVLFLLNGSARFQTMWQHAIAFLVLVIVLMFRPAGLLGEHVTEKV